MKEERISASKIKFWFLIAFILFSTLFSLSLGIFDINQSTIETFLKDNSYFSKIIFLIIMTIAVATTLPVNLVSLAGLFVFDFQILIVMTLISITLGVLIMYLIAKSLGEKGFEEYAGIKGSRINILHKLIKKHKYSLMIILSFVYFFPSNMAGITAAFTRTKLSKFFVISFLGNAINIIFFITLARGILIKDLALALISTILLIANTAIPLVYYRKNIKDVAKLVLAKEL